MFDHIGGFYLLGEGISPDLVPKIHQVFSDYCMTHHAVEMRHSHEVSVEYQPGKGHPHLPSQHPRMVMHYPFSAPQR
jgi:hypothetical protein